MSMVKTGGLCQVLTYSRLASGDEKDGHRLDDAGFSELDGLDDFVFLRVDDDDRSVVFRVNISAFAVRRECDGTWAMADFEGSKDLFGCRGRVRRSRSSLPR